ncbi:MAG: thiamine phosphate synthase [Pseudomonadota bacterium]
MRSRPNTYDKGLRAASPALCGRGGAALVRSGRAVSAFVFVGARDLKRANLVAAIRTLHPAIGVVVRDYEDDDPQAVADIITLCRLQRRIVLSAGPDTHGSRHIPRWQHAHMRSKGIRSFSVHTASEAVRARRAGANLVFISPLFQTSSHPGAKPIGLFEGRRLARTAKAPAFALGGITIKRSKRLIACGHFQGVGAISAFLKD